MVFVACKKLGEQTSETVASLLLSYCALSNQCIIQYTEMSPLKSHCVRTVPIYYISETRLYA